MMPTQHIVDYNTAVKILLNNHWYRPNQHVWQSPTNLGHFINESQLHADPRATMSQASFDWDAEETRLNTGGTIAWPMIPTSLPVFLKGGWKYPKSELYEDWADKPNGLAGCTHKWAVYTGLQEVFEYCTMCDQKK